MRNRKSKFIAFMIMAVVAGAAAAWIGSVRNAALKALADERLTSAARSVIPVEKTELEPYVGNDVRFIQNIRSVQDLAAYRGEVFAATSGGLVELSSDGELLRHYTVLDGLVESDPDSGRDLPWKAVYRNSVEGTARVRRRAFCRLQMDRQAGADRHIDGH
jgi:hypothetical protein